VEKHNGYFDVCLYNTVMARFFKPENDGRVVWYAGDSSPTSKAFMWHVLHTGFLRKETTIAGAHVAVPISGNRELSTRLTYIGDRLDVSRSTHSQMVVYRMSEENKKERAVLREQLKFWMHAMELRMPTFEKQCDAMPGWSKSPFVKIEGLLNNEPGDEGWVDDLTRYAQAVYTSLVLREYRKNDRVSKDLPSPTPEVFLHSLERNVLKELGADKRDARIELPLFMDWYDYPKGATR
jgi:hypothetical protein